MKYKIHFDRDNLDSGIKDVNSWARVDPSLLTEKDAARFKTRENAICAYLAEEPVDKICEEFGITRQEIHRLLKRCLEIHPDGEIWGFRALIPYGRQKAYERTMEGKINVESKRGGSSGQLSRLFDKFPQIQETVETMFLKKFQQGIVHESRIPLKAIHKRFINACRQVGLTAKHYPFSVKHLGYIALWKYLKKLFGREQARGTLVRYGKDAARTFITGIGAGGGGLSGESIVRPYQRVEFDAHLIDLFCTIKIPSPYGGYVERVLDRIWLLVIIEVLTRAVLGYHLSFGKQYSADDVLLCVKNAIIPWQPKTLTIPGLRYPEKGGIPSEVFEELSWALWDELSYDNAKANLASAVRDKLTSVVGCAVNAGPIKTPERRPFIERFFGVLEENGFHRLPSTTGNSPKDSRRDEPEKVALDLHISLEHIEELTGVMIAQYNGTPHSGIGFRSPLEYLEFFINSDNIPPRRIPQNQRNHLNLLNIQVSRIVRGDSAKGRSSHINFEGVKYRNDVLSHTPDLIGTRLSLIVDPTDIRSITAYLPNGAELGVLTAQGFWGRTPHTLEMRKAILWLRYRKLIWYTEADDPVQFYMDYLGEQSGKSKAARRSLAKARSSNKRNAGRQHSGKCKDSKKQQPGWEEAVLEREALEGVEIGLSETELNETGLNEAETPVNEDSPLILKTFTF